MFLLQNMMDKLFKTSNFLILCIFIILYIRLVTTEVAESPNQIQTFSYFSVFPMVLKGNSSNEKNCSAIKRVGDDFQFKGKFVVAFTAGWHDLLDKTYAKAGVGVWFGKKHPLNISKPSKSTPSEIAPQVEACIECLKLLKDKGFKYVEIHTDSSHVIYALNYWLAMWKQNNWHTKAGNYVKNKEEFLELELLVREFQTVKWVHSTANYACPLEFLLASELAQLGGLNDTKQETP